MLPPAKQQHTRRGLYISYLGDSPQSTQNGSKYAAIGIIIGQSKNRVLGCPAEGWIQVLPDHFDAAASLECHGEAADLQNFGQYWPSPFEPAVAGIGTRLGFSKVGRRAPLLSSSLSGWSEASPDGTMLTQC